MADAVRILLVDDEEDILDSLADVLAAALPAEATCAKATSVADAQRMVAEEDFDLVLTDERMPGGTGSELLAWLQERHPDVHRGLMSAYYDAGAGFRQGKTAAEFYVRKPFDSRELVPVLQRAVALGRRARRAPGFHAPPG